MSRTVTTTQQFKIMVSFMEQHGDLNKPCNGIRAKLARNRLWHQLTDTLNSGSGDPKPVERWKKVWSDCKNNVKKKVIRLRRASSTTGELGETEGLTELERRVIKVLKASGGFTQQKPRAYPSDSSDNSTGNPQGDMQWDTPISNSDITVIQSDMKLEDSLTTSTTEPTPEFVNAIPVPPQSASTEPPPQRKNLPPPGPLRRVRFRLENPTDRTLDYLTNSDRERRNEQRQRDEEERRYRRESDIRREAMERRWQNLFERLINVVERLIE